MPDLPANGASREVRSAVDVEVELLRAALDVAQQPSIAHGDAADTRRQQRHEVDDDRPVLSGRRLMDVEEMDRAGDAAGLELGDAHLPSGPVDGGDDVAGRVEVALVGRSLSVDLFVAVQETHQLAPGRCRGGDAGERAKSDGSCDGDDDETVPHEFSFRTETCSRLSAQKSRARGSGAHNPPNVRRDGSRARLAVAETTSCGASL